MFTNCQILTFTNNVQIPFATDWFLLKISIHPFSKHNYISFITLWRMDKMEVYD